LLLLVNALNWDNIEDCLSMQNIMLQLCYYYVNIDPSVV